VGVPARHHEELRRALEAMVAQRLPGARVLYWT
jgi:hypothetical protein